MSETETYEIRIQGRLPERWSSWFDGMEITATDDGGTLIRGEVADQAALHGLIQKVRDLGLPLLSVTHTQTGDTQTGHAQTGHTQTGHTQTGHRQAGATS